MECTNLEGSTELIQATAIHLCVGEVQVAESGQADQPGKAVVERQAVAAVRARQPQMRQGRQARDAAHCHVHRTEAVRRQVEPAKQAQSMSSNSCSSLRA